MEIPETKTSYSQKVWIGYNMELSEQVYWFFDVLVAVAVLTP